MSTPDYDILVSNHRKYFQSGATRSVEWREKQLTALRAMMKDHAEEFYGALWTDLRRNRIDSDWSDVKFEPSFILGLFTEVVLGGFRLGIVWTTQSLGTMRKGFRPLTR